MRFPRHVRAVSVAVLLMAATAPAWASDLATGAAALLAGDYAKAERLIRPLAERGDPEAQYLMGKGCDSWRWPGSKQSGCNFVWYSKAAAQGHVEANSALGRLYRYGSTEPLNKPLAKNVQESLDRLNWAAERGSVSAQTALASYFSNEGAAPRHVMDSTAADQGYYWDLVIMKMVKDHPELMNDPNIADTMSHMKDSVGVFKSRLTPRAAAIDEFLADGYEPRKERVYPGDHPRHVSAEPWKPLTPEEEKFKEKMSKLSDDFD